VQYLHYLPFSYPVLWARDGCLTLVARDRFQSRRIPPSRTRYCCETWRITSSVMLARVLLTLNKYRSTAV
jgi:hypothetical protein